MLGKLVVAIALVLCAAEDDIVAVGGGRVLGVRDSSNDIRFWKGIPFGASTGGKGRFQPPVPRASWANVLNCTVYGAGCISDHHGVDTAPIQSEDCLNLNVYVPLNASLQVSIACDRSTLCLNGTLVLIALN